MTKRASSGLAGDPNHNAKIVCLRESGVACKQSMVQA